MLAAAVEAGGQDAGIVEDEAVVGCQIGREIAEHAVFPPAGGAIDDEHPRPGAVGEGFLGDQIVGEVVVEVGEAHVFKTSRTTSVARLNADLDVRATRCALPTTVNWKPDADSGD